MTRRLWIVFPLVLPLFLLVACDGRPRKTVDPAPVPASGSPNAETPRVAVLEVHVTDAGTGKPITHCGIVGWDEGRTFTEVTPSGYDVAADGVHRFELTPMSGRVRLAADGYSETWSKRFRLRAGTTERLAVSMNRLSRLVVTVVETDGSPVKEGTLLLKGPDLLRTLVVENGVVDQRVDPGRVRLVVDPRFMEGYEPHSQWLTLSPGERTELTLRVKRR